ncbi:disease resistance protein RPP13-like [Aegilops tauschii subsp. strangulata]|uniref:Disease resistance protein RPP13 n=1 Tax=Aegilops tauschii TaxID=37682 RepID=R7W1X9_AEGTA
MAESAIGIVLGNVNNLAVRETCLLCGVTLEVTFLKDELMRLQGSLIRDAAYEAENVIEAADYMKKRNMIKKGFMGAISSHVMDDSVEDCGLMHQHCKDDVTMVGFEDEYKEIVDTLVEGENMLSVVSIVAMGGAGKITLARKVYTSSGVKQHFESLVWVTVSQKLMVIDLLKEILKQILSDGDQSTKIDDMNEYEVGKKIHDILIKKRYLLVLDDVWETDIWEQTNRTIKAFPDAANCSRVLLTTRKGDVANHVEMPTHIHALRSLDEEKSWELFSNRALPSYKRSGIRDLDKYEELGRKLTRKCDGLPLSLAVLGGYLSKNLNTQSWSDVLLCWPSTKDTQMMRGIIARSYKDLPNHYLRSCVLYLAAFPEDYIISVSALINLWIAEGFIPHTPKHTLEKTARQAGASSSHNQIFYCSSFQNLSGQILQASPNLRAMFGFGLSSVSFHELRFLRVLHVENSRIKNISELKYYRSRTMSSGAQGFPHLQELELFDCSFIKWTMEVGTMPKLLYMLFGVCRLVEEIPDGLLHLPSLRFVSAICHDPNESTLVGLRHKGCKVTTRHDFHATREEE